MASNTAPPESSEPTEPKPSLQTVGGAASPQARKPPCPPLPVLTVLAALDDELTIDAPPWPALLELVAPPLPVAVVALEPLAVVVLVDVVLVLDAVLVPDAP